MKKIKLTTSIILILAMLLLPFTSLLNVKAEATQITVDTNTAKSDDPNSKKVTNTTKLTVTGGADLLKAYKVLDIYYNETSNQMSYDFTSTFTGFKASSYATTTTKDFSTLTVSEYLAYGEEGANQTEFNLLAAQFAKYVKKNNITGLAFSSDTTTPPEGKNSFDVYIESIEVGAYLLLSTTNNPFIDKDGDQIVNTYGALIANVVFNVESDGWHLNERSIGAKLDENDILSRILNCSASNIIQEYDNADEVNTFYKNKDYTYLLDIAAPSDYVTDTSSYKVTITFPEGIDYNGIYTAILKDNYSLYPVSNNKLYYDNNIVADITTEGKVITITSPTEEFRWGFHLVVGVKLSDTPVLGEAGNTIKAEATYITDPYSDPIGTTTLTDENKVITYGLQITNKDASSDANLSGGVFGIYTDSTCSDSSKIGEVTVTDGVVKFAGVTDGDLYVKQITAPSGYKLSTDVAHITIDTTSLTSEGYYPLEVKNAKQGLLPSTGGLGTIFYTLIGLLVIGAGAYSVVKYSKKQINS